MTDKPVKIPNPGSFEAEKIGCLCPVMDNEHGRGQYGDGEKFGWWINDDCPLHGTEKKHD